MTRPEQQLAQAEPDPRLEPGPTIPERGGCLSHPGPLEWPLSFHSSGHSNPPAPREIIRMGPIQPRGFCSLCAPSPRAGDHDVQEALRTQMFLKGRV